MKRFLSIFLSLSMLFGATMPVWANDQDAAASEEDTFEVIASEEEVFEDKEVLSETPTPEVMEHRIFIDGKEFPCEPGYMYHKYDVYYRYTSIAEALGFSVFFDAETGMVHTDGNDLSCTFDTVASYGTFTENGKTTELEYYPLNYLTNIEDKMYIASFCIEYHLSDYIDVDIRIDDETHDIFIYTSEGKRAMADALNNKFTMLGDMQAELEGKDYLSDGACELTLNINSDLFGIEGNGQSKILYTSAKYGEKVYTKIHTEGSGLMNLIPLLTGLFDIYEEPENEEEYVDFPNTSDTEFYYDGTYLYIKGDYLANDLFMSEIFDDIYYDFPTTMDLSDPWIYTEDITENYMLLLTGGDLGMFLVNTAFEDSYTKPEEILAVYEALLGDENFTCTEGEQGKTYTYTLNKETLLAALEPKMANATEEERAEFDEQMKYLGLDLTISQSTTENGGTNTSQGTLTLSNIENPWNEQVFSLTLDLQSSGSISFTEAESFVFPDVSNAVNLTELAKQLKAEAEESAYDDTESVDE